MEERRIYNRIDTTIPAVAYFSDKGEEYGCEIVNVSEEGMGIVFPALERVSLSPGDEIMLRFCDKSLSQGREGASTLTLRAKVCHMEREGSRLHMGCSLSNRLFREYVRKKGVGHGYVNA